MPTEKLELVEFQDKLYPWQILEGGRVLGRFPTKEIAERVKKSLEETRD